MNNREVCLSMTVLKSPMISVIVPCYNCESLLERCVRSILNQSLSDFELILVNDASTDGTWELMQKLSGQDKRIRCLHSASDNKSIGPGPARNVGIDVAVGEYIAFADDDDAVLSNWLEYMYTVAHSKEADLVACAFYEVNGSTERHVLFNDTFDIRGGVEHS